MQTNDLIDIFHDCVTRLEQGETVDDCLQIYPEYADDLLPMLEAIRIPTIAQVSADDVAVSQARVSVVFDRALNQPSHIGFRYGLSRVASIIFLILFVGSLLTTGVVVVAQDSIPGDQLYGVKRLTEQIRLTLANDDTELRDEFDQRRIEEVREVIQRRRATRVEFSGIVEQIDDPIVEIAGFTVEVSPRLRTIVLLIGMRVHVIAETQTDGSIIATDLQVDRLPDLSAPIASSPTPPQPTLMMPSMTITLDISATPTPTATSIQTTPTIIPTTATRHVTDRPITTPETRLTSTPLATPPADDCDATAPDGWTSYTVQAGDTPSDIAVGTDLSLDEFYDANCHINPRLIVVGEEVYVPYEPRFPTRVNATPEPEFTQESIRVTAVPQRENSDSSQQTRPIATPVPSRNEEGSNSRQREGQNEEDDDSRRGR